MTDVFCEQRKFFDFIDKQISSHRLSHAFCIETNNYERTNVLVTELCKRIINSSDESVNFLIDNNKYPDIVFISPDGDFIKKNQLLSIRNDFAETSILNGKKIYIISDVTSLNSSSANTILKFLEEPSPDVYAILLCSSRYKVIETVISRCQILSLDVVDSNNLVKNDDEKFMLIQIADIILSGYSAFLKYSDLVLFFDDRRNCIELFKKLELYFFDLYKSDCCDRNIEKSKLLLLISLFEEYFNRLKYNLNFKLFFDDFIIRVGEVLE